MADATQEVRPDDRQERESALAEFEHWIEKPMQVLGFIWLALLIVEFTRGRSTLVAVLSTIIWVVFIIDFTVRLILAPSLSSPGLTRQRSYELHLRRVVRRSVASKDVMKPDLRLRRVLVVP